MAEPSAKIFVRIDPGDRGGAPILALLDTGCAYSILDRQVAEDLGLLTEDGPTIEITTRRGSIEFRMIRLPVVILAEEGDSLSVDASVCISDDWIWGNFLGCSGLLEAIRFAVDPQANQFYFGGYVEP